MVGRICSRCGAWYAPYLMAAAFRAFTDSMHLNSRRNICRPCEQTAKDRRKQSNRYAVKARDTIRRHSPRLGVSKEDLICRYGWEPARMAHDAEFQYGNGCSYCGHPYAQMGHGLSDITLDIVDRSKPPYYRTNTKWCCQTCNRKKGDRGPEFFELDRQVYEVWTAAQQMSADELGRLF